MPSARILVVRHGETRENAMGIIQGQLDTELASEGLAQARIAGRYLRPRNFDMAFTSDLKRANLTAEIIMEQGKHECELERTELFRERFLGGMQGKRRDQRQPGDYDSAEPSDELELRLLRAWDYVLERVASHPRARQLGQGGSTEQEPLLQVMVLSHGAAIRALVSGLFSRRAAEYEVKPGVDVHKGIANCSVTEFHVERTEKGWKGEMLTYGDAGYFADSSRAVTPTDNADVLDDQK